MCETYIDERTVPMNNAPRVLSTGIDAGMVDGSQKRDNKSQESALGRNIRDSEKRSQDAICILWWSKPMIDPIRSLSASQPTVLPN